MSTEIIENFQNTEELSKENENSKEVCKEKQCHNSKKKQRKMAKLGLVATMGIVTLTGFVASKKVHTIAGIVMLGFSAWHASLYSKKTKKEESPKN